MLASLKHLTLKSRRQSINARFIIYLFISVPGEYFRWRVYECESDSSLCRIFFVESRDAESDRNQVYRTYIIRTCVWCSSGLLLIMFPFEVTMKETWIYLYPSFGPTFALSSNKRNNICGLCSLKMLRHIAMRIWIHWEQ